MLAENLNANMQITSVRSLITIFVTETLMKEYDMDRELWLIAYFAVGKLTETMSFRMCSLLYTFISFERKKDSQGGSLSARSFDLARPDFAPPLRPHSAYVYLSHVHLLLQICVACLSNCKILLQIKPNLDVSLTLDAGESESRRMLEIRRYSL